MYCAAAATLTTQLFARVHSGSRLYTSLPYPVYSSINSASIITMCYCLPALATGPYRSPSPSAQTSLEHIPACPACRPACIAVQHTPPSGQHVQRAAQHAQQPSACLQRPSMPSAQPSMHIQRPIICVQQPSIPSVRPSMHSSPACPACSPEYIGLQQPNMQYSTTTQSTVAAQAPALPCLRVIDL
jgi:hypothetical protein